MYVPLLALALLPCALADDALRVFHRLRTADAPDQPFVLRGSLSVSGSGPDARASLASSEPFVTDLARFAQAAESTPGALYQLALEHKANVAVGGTLDPSQWAVSSVKACHLLQSTQEDIVVHLAQDGTPFALDYFVSPTPHDGACPKKRRPKSGAARSSSAENLLVTAVRNVSISVTQPRLPPLPQLRAPPPLTVEGKPVEPEPERSFIQKYWFYGAVVVLALLMAGGPEEGGGENAAGGRR